MFDEFFGQLSPNLQQESLANVKVNSWQHCGILDVFTQVDLVYSVLCVITF